MTSHQRPTQPQIHDGPFQLGSRVIINQREVVIESFIAEGGFAHVYTAISGDSRVVLKRISCADQTTLKELMREAQKSITGHPNIIQFIDYTYQPLQQGGYELLILMEHAMGGHLVDYLNARIDNRPLEPEIISIFSQICQGVAHLHSRNPPIIHRDLKIENVLLCNPYFKLCDFGSCTTEIIPPRGLTIQEIRRLEDEISKYTTIQYRAPEQCDLYQRKGLDEKVDIWALGVLLYKLCFYTTPFEHSGKMGILSGIVNIPDYPPYSQNLKQLILMMLQVDIEQRLDIYQLAFRVNQLQGIPYNLPIVFMIDKMPKPVNNLVLKEQPSQSQGPFREVHKVSNPFEDVNVKIEPMRRGRPKANLGSQDLLQSNGNLATFDDNFGKGSGAMQINSTPPTFGATSSTFGMMNPPTQTHPVTSFANPATQTYSAPGFTSVPNVHVYPSLHQMPSIPSMQGYIQTPMQVPHRTNLSDTSMNRLSQESNHSISPNQNSQFDLSPSQGFTQTAFMANQNHSVNMFPQGHISSPFSPFDASTQPTYLGQQTKQSTQRTSHGTSNSLVNNGNFALETLSTNSMGNVSQGNASTSPFSPFSATAQPTYHNQPTQQSPKRVSQENPNPLNTNTTAVFDQNTFSNAPWPQPDSIPPPKPPRSGRQTLSSTVPVLQGEDGMLKAKRNSKGDEFVSKMVERFNKQTQ